MQADPLLCSSSGGGRVSGSRAGYDSGLSVCKWNKQYCVTHCTALHRTTGARGQGPESRVPATLLGCRRELDLVSSRGGGRKRVFSAVRDCGVNGVQRSCALPWAWLGKTSTFLVRGWMGGWVAGWVAARMAGRVLV